MGIVGAPNEDWTTAQVSVRVRIVPVGEAVTRESAGKGAGEAWRNHILWVDDRPSNNVHERQAFEAMGLRFTLALSTDDAFTKLAAERFAAIISDMGRPEGPREGYVLLERLRSGGDSTPLFIYAGSNSLEHRREIRKRGGQGTTNDPQELVEMVTQAVFGNQVR
jgi:CheY-like chemotaxis protein